MNYPEVFIVAAAQATPVFLDRTATLAKACDLIAEASRHGAKLIVFPEAFLSAYPDWVWLIPGNRPDLLNALFSFGKRGRKAGSGDGKGYSEKVYIEGKSSLFKFFRD